MISRAESSRNLKQRQQLQTAKHLLESSREAAIERLRYEIVNYELTGQAIPQKLLDDLDGWVKESQPAAMDVDLPADQHICNQDFYDDDFSADTTEMPNEYASAVFDLLESLNEIAEEQGNQTFEQQNPSVSLASLFEALAAELVFSHNLPASTGQLILNAIRLGYRAGTAKHVKVRTFETVSDNVLKKVDIRTYYNFICINNNCLSANGVHRLSTKAVPLTSAKIDCENFDLNQHLSEKSYFMYISIEDQLKLILSLFSEEIFAFKRQAHAQEQLTSICNGKVYKQNASDPNCLTLNLCTDEVKLDQSKHINCLGVIFYLNELPPHLRKKFPIYAAIFASEKKIKDPTKIFDSVCEELSCLWERGFEWEANSGRTIFVKQLCIVADAPMRSYLLNIKSCTATQGCPWCTHRSTRVNPHYAHYGHISIAENMEMLRRNSDYDSSRSGQSDSIKGPTSFLKLPEYDVFQSFTVDPMHNVSLGVVKYWLKHIWLCKSTPSEHEVEDESDYDEEEDAITRNSKRVSSF